MSAVNWYNSQNSLVGFDRGQRRKSPRRPVNLAALIMDRRAGLMLRDCTMVDVSEGGARLKVEGAGSIPEYFTLVLSHGARTHRNCQVRWRSETELGVQFIRD